MPLGRPQDVSEGHPQDICWTRPLHLNIIPYENVLIMSGGGVLKPSVEDIPWCCI